MPNTRSSNKTANFKAYYAKKAAPYQQHFPHRRKTVRRPDAHDDGGKKQMKFLPGMMRRTSTVRDSDAESAASLEAEAEEMQSRKKGTKRNSDAMRDEADADEDEELVPKRRRETAVRISTSKPEPRLRRGAAAVAPASEGSDASDATEEEVPRPRLRRQSTMTQMAGGRSPALGSTEPAFKPVKRASRTSWGGKGRKKDVKKDLKQRTLTQMVSTMTPLVFASDEELEEDRTDEEADAAHHSFIFGNDEEEAVQQHTPAGNDNGENVPPCAATFPAADGSDDGGEDEYQPMQFIEAPVTRTRRTPLRASTRCQATPAATIVSKPPVHKSPKTRFGLLSTPEKRGVFEIPSSQSPPETPFSMQNTPRTSGRRPLQPRFANTPKPTESPSERVAETPSKRKQVIFQEGPQEQIPPPALKKFASTIPDSEDEEGRFSDSDDQSDTEYHVGEETQALLRNVDGPVPLLNVGAETQAMLLDIDRACANVDEDTAWANRDGSEELREPVVHQDDADSEELDHQLAPRTGSDITGEQSADAPELPPLPFSSPKPQNSLSANVEPSETITSPPVIQVLPSSPPVEDFRTQPPTPMFADDESPEEVEEPDKAAVQHPLTPTKQPRSSPPIEDFRTQPTIPMFDDDEVPSEDLDDVPAAVATSTTIDHPPQVPRSPPTHLHPEPSHSSQAEQQLQSEYQTYSQYRRPGPPPSSMRVTHDSNYSYQATPHPFPRDPTQLQPQSHSNYISQATTVDPTQISPKVTPRKTQAKPPMFTSPVARVSKSSQKLSRSAATTPKTQRQLRSATTTPKPAKGDAPVRSSPEASRPAPLFIPSSFPSPARVTMEGWSSPVMGREQGESQWGVGSLEDFSIPAPPPGSSQWVDDDDDEEL